jgi:hypothetical protein
MESSAKKPDQKRPDRSIECVAALVILVGALSVGGMMTINNYMGKGLLGKMLCHRTSSFDARGEVGDARTL